MFIKLADWIHDDIKDAWRAIEVLTAAWVAGVYAIGVWITTRAFATQLPPGASSD